MEQQQVLQYHFQILVELFLQIILQIQVAGTLPQQELNFILTTMELTLPR